MKDKELRRTLGYTERDTMGGLGIRRETDLDSFKASVMRELHDIREFLGVEYSAPERIPSKLVPKPKRTMKIPK